MTSPAPQDAALTARLQAVATNAGDLSSYLLVTAAFCGVRATRKPSNVKKGRTMRYVVTIQPPPIPPEILSQTTHQVVVWADSMAAAIASVRATTDPSNRILHAKPARSA